MTTLSPSAFLPRYSAGPDTDELVSDWDLATTAYDDGERADPFEVEIGNEWHILLAAVHDEREAFKALDQAAIDRLAIAAVDCLVAGVRLEGAA